MLFSLYAKYLEAPVQLSFLNHQVHDVPIITALSHIPFVPSCNQVCPIPSLSPSPVSGVRALARMKAAGQAHKSAGLCPLTFPINLSHGQALGVALGCRKLLANEFMSAHPSEACFPTLPHSPSGLPEIEPRPGSQRLVLAPDAWCDGLHPIPPLHID